MNSKRGFIYRRDYSLKNPRTIGKRYEAREPGRLRDSIRASVHYLKNGKGVVLFLEAGSEDAFYAPFVEFGTYKMRARPFLRPAFARYYLTARQAIMSGMAMRRAA